MIAAEALINAVAGLLISWLLTMLALPLWGYAPSAGDAAGITVMYFIASFCRSYVIRRIFAGIA